MSSSPYRKSPYSDKKQIPWRARSVTIIGEAPNAQGKEKYDTVSGQRIAAWAGTELPWHNIHGALPPKWSNRVSRIRVRDWVAQHPKDDQPFILLGRKVQNAFYIPRGAESFEWYMSPVHHHPMVLFPHTSPLNRFWNDEANVARATELLHQLVSGELPRHDYKKVDETA